MICEICEEEEQAHEDAAFAAADAEAAFIEQMVDSEGEHQMFKERSAGMERALEESERQREQEDMIASEATLEELEAEFGPEAEAWRREAEAAEAAQN